jgi:hypothetical protein
MPLVMAANRQQTPIPLVVVRVAASSQQTPMPLVMAAGRQQTPMPLVVVRVVMAS